MVLMDCDSSGLPSSDMGMAPSPRQLTLTPAMARICTFVASLGLIAVTITTYLQWLHFNHDRVYPGEPQASGLVPAAGEKPGRNRLREPRARLLRRARSRMAQFGPVGWLGPEWRWTRSGAQPGLDAGPGTPAGRGDSRYRKRTRSSGPG